jgi:hypothetical protein
VLVLGAGLFAASARGPGVAQWADAAVGMKMGRGSSMAHMGSVGASHSGGAHSVSMGSMSMTVGSHVTNILPTWLAVVATLLFVVIIATHARHAAESDGQRRYWHSGHVLMAFGMAFMFAPASIDPINIPSGLWSLVFANAAVAIPLWIIVHAYTGRGTNPLWLLTAFDFAAMAYMWSPSGYEAPVTWLLVAYFAWQAALWGSNWMRKLDQHTILGGAVSVTAEGAVVAAVAEPLICYKDLRVSMSAMMLGMAYMFAAMQLLM